MTPLDATTQAFRARLTRDLSHLEPGQLDATAVDQLIERYFEELEQGGTTLDDEEKQIVANGAWEAVLGFGPIAALLRDPEVTEIMINGADRIFVERGGITTRADVRFEGDDALRGAVQRMMLLAPGKRLDLSSPYVDLSLPGGTRVNICLPPIVAGGPHITIRKYLRSIATLEDVLDRRSLDERMGRLLAAAVKCRASILFSGAAGTGKTTLLEAVARHIDPSERILVIEDTMELHFGQPNVVRLLTRTPNVEGKGEVTIGELFRNTLRMRPNRILLGEIRGREALDYLQALNSGHRGTLAVIHAAAPEEAVIRLENLVPLAGLGIPFQVTRKQIAQGLDLIVQMSRWPDGVRRVDRITEVAGLAADGTVALRDLFQFRPDGIDGHGRVIGRYVSTGVVPQLHETWRLAGVWLPLEDYRAG